MIRSVVWNGLQAVEFAAGGYEALLIPSMGANLVRLRHAATGIEVLRTPTADDMETFLSRPQIFGLPLLFPPNRIGDGRYAFGGRTYQFPITIPAQNNYHHGIIKGLPFTVASCHDGGEWVEIDAVYFSNAANDAIYKDFPHAFECVMHFTLSAQGLEHAVAFRNLSDEDMPVGVGYHTPLNVPFTAEGKGSDYRLRLSVGQRWELSSDRTLPTGKLLPLTEAEALLRSEGGVCPIGEPVESAFTDEPLMVDGAPYSGAILTDTASGRTVYYQVDEKMKHWTLWNNGGSVPWVCPEPQSWAINAPNLDLPAAVTGFKAIKPCEEWSSVSRIYVK